MAWQDFVFAGGNVVLSIGLVFSIVGPHKPAVYTSLITGLTISTFAVSFATMDLWFSAAGAATNAAFWWLLLAQGMRAQRLSEPLS